MEFNATFLVSAVSFIIFTLIMNKLLYQPISDIIAKRQAFLDGNSVVAKKNLDESVALRDDKAKKVSTTRTEVKRMISEEVAKSKGQKAQKEKEKKSEMADKIAEQKQALANEKANATDRLSESLDELSESIISKLSGGEF